MYRPTMICSLVASAAAMLASGTAQAAVITTAGSSLNTPAWVDAGIGDLGSIFFSPVVEGTNVSTGIVGTGGSVTTTILASSDEDGDALTGVLIQNPDGTPELDFDPGAIFDTGVSGAGAKTDLVSFTFGAGAPTQLTLGVLVGVNEVGGSSTIVDVPNAILLSDDGGTTSVKITTVTPAGNQADFYFFNVTGITDGTVLTVLAEAIDDTSGNRFNPINGVVFSTIPEPASLALMGLGGLLMLGRGRRREA